MSDTQRWPPELRLGYRFVAAANLPNQLHSSEELYLYEY